ncbi:MAG: DUF2179 domain-containing protein [Bacteroidales bacterium]|jgi:uncharacterized protein YebE (UPF0316 family)|nr:DUF2179 domain-containing protein [Bacteroidales bacterium]
MTDQQIYQYIILPLIIFFARICDVSLGTLRIVFVSKGKKNIAPILGFFEVFIWIVVISQILKNVDSIVGYLAYAGGYAAGNYIGMYIEERIAFGTQLIKVFSAKDIAPLQKCLNAAGFGTTLVDGDGSSGKVTILYTVINRKTFEQARKILVEFDPLIFYVIEDVRLVKSGIFPETKHNRPFQRFFWRSRPGK